MESLYKRPAGHLSTPQSNSRSSAAKMVKCRVNLLLWVAVASSLVTEVVSFETKSAAGSKRYPKTGIEKRIGEAETYDQQNQQNYYSATTASVNHQVEYSNHDDTEDMDVGSSHQYVEYQNYQSDDGYSATQAATRPLKTKVRYHEDADTENSNEYLRIKKQHATDNRIRTKQTRRRPVASSSYATQSSATEKHDSYGLSYYCKNLGGKYTELVALISFLSLAFIVFYLLYLSKSTTTTTGKEIEGDHGLMNTIQDFAGYVKSNLNSNCGQYRLCQMGKFSKLINVDAFSVGFFSEALTNGLDGTNCGQLYPNCSLSSLL